MYFYSCCRTVRFIKTSALKAQWLYNSNLITSNGFLDHFSDMYTYIYVRPNKTHWDRIHMLWQSNHLGYILDFTSTSCLLDWKCDIWRSSVIQLWIIIVAVSRPRGKKLLFVCLGAIWACSLQVQAFRKAKNVLNQDVVGRGLDCGYGIISKQCFMQKEFHHMNLQTINLPLSTCLLLFLTGM